MNAANELKYCEAIERLNRYTATLSRNDSQKIAVIGEAMRRLTSTAKINIRIRKKVKEDGRG